MKKLFFMLMFLASISAFSENELQLENFILFRDDKTEVDYRRLTYLSKYMDINLNNINYKNKEIGNIDLINANLKLETKYLEFNIGGINFYTNGIEIFNEKMRMKNEEIIYYNFELRNNNKKWNTKLGAFYLKDDLLLKSNKFYGRLEDIEIINIYSSFGIKNKKINYSYGQFKTDAVLNEVSKIGDASLKYHYADISYNELSIYYINFKTEANYTFDFSTVGLLAISDQNYFDIDGEINLYGAKYIKEFNYKKLKLKIFSVLGSVYGGKCKLELKSRKKYLFGETVEKEEVYNLKLKIPFYFITYLDLKYDINDKFNIGMKKYIPYVSGIKMKNIKEEEEEEEDDSSDKNDVDYVLSGLSIYLEFKF